jgi:hypothetical protein
VVGVPRSGTTLLRLMLDAHPEVAVPPETGFAPLVIRACRSGLTPAGLVELLSAQRRWGDFDVAPGELLGRLDGVDRVSARKALRTFYEIYADHQHKPRWGDKTPPYAKHIELIAGALPEAAFIHLIRDGRDRALSWAEISGKPVLVERRARRWKRWIRTARRQGARVERYMEVRYEDLVFDPEPELRRICDFAELEWDPAMLRHHERAPERLAELGRDLPATEAAGERAGALDPSMLSGKERTGSWRLEAHALAARPASAERVGRWKTDMAPDDVAAFERIAGDLLAELGYEVTTGAHRTR